ncbi:MAG: hypothetical protein ACI9S8_001581 [Chlamydiales bacterium]|jgi:hypothetical protein
MPTMNSFFHTRFPQISHFHDLGDKAFFPYHHLCGKYLGRKVVVARREGSNIFLDSFEGSSQTASKICQLSQKVFVVLAFFPGLVFGMILKLLSFSSFDVRQAYRDIESESLVEVEPSQSDREKYIDFLVELRVDREVSLFKKRAELNEQYLIDSEQIEGSFRERQRRLSKTKSKANKIEALRADGEHAFDEVERFAGLSILQLRTLGEWKWFKNDLIFRLEKRISGLSIPEYARKFLDSVALDHEHSQNLELLNSEISSGFETSSFVQKLI